MKWESAFIKPSHLIIAKNLLQLHFSSLEKKRCHEPILLETCPPKLTVTSSVWSDIIWVADFLSGLDFDKIIVGDYFHIAELFHIIATFERLSWNRKYSFLLYFILLGCIPSLFRLERLRLRFYVCD